MDCCLQNMAHYKIKDLESLTGIKAHTIRIWEKRYGLLNPCRTDTNLRTYTDEDLQTILLVSVLNNNGVKISHIADMTPEERSNRVKKYQLESLESNAVEQFILALLRLDEQLFCRTFDDLIESHGLEETFSDHIIPFLDRIGVMWLVGTINPAQEHFITHLIRQKVITAIDKLEATNDDHAKKVILYLPEHEWHELGLLFYHYILKKLGWKVYYLGQSVPLDAVKQIIGQVNPDLVVSSWVVSIDDCIISAHISELRSFYKGQLAIGGSQVLGRNDDRFDIISKHDDLYGIVSSAKKAS